MKYALAAIAVLGASLSLAGTAQAQYGGVDLNAYCQARHGGYSRVILLDPGDAYTWRCVVRGSHRNISVDEACRRQYGPGARARLGHRGDPNSWTCG